MANTLVGIHHGDGQRRAYPAQRQNLVALRSLERDQLDNGRIDFKVGKIDGGNAILAREEIRDIFVGKESELDQRRPRRQFGLLLDLHRLFQLLWGNDLLLDEKVTQPLRHTSISYLIGREIQLSSGFSAHSRNPLEKTRPRLAR